jgi:membrane-associated protease RseP (regulator of RpoE activity)
MRFWVPEHHHALEKAAYLGLTASPVTAALREQLKLQKGFGMVVDFVEPGSPAEAAGIKRYDVLQNFNDQILIDSYQLAILIRSFKPGDEIKLTVLHQGQSQVVSAKLIEKEVEVLDENNPGSMPPMPWGRAEGIEQHYFPGPGPGEGPHGRPTSRPSDRR